MSLLKEGNSAWPSKLLTALIEFTQDIVKNKKNDNISLSKLKGDLNEEYLIRIIGPHIDFCVRSR